MTKTGTELMLELSPSRRHRIAMLERSYRAEIEPLLKMKAWVFGLTMPTRMIFFPDGRYEVEYKHAPAVQAALDQIDALLADIRKRYEAKLR